MSRRLRPRCLLLLVPVLMASTPPSLSGMSGLVLAAAGQPDHLALLGVPPEFPIDQCMQFRVELRDSNEAPANTATPIQVQLISTLMGGAFYPTSSCEPATAITSVVIYPGTSSANAWYRATMAGSGTLSATANGLGDALPRLLSVVDFPTTELQFTAVPSRVTAGVLFHVTVMASNQNGPATGYAGTIYFTTTASDADLPASYTFTPNDQGQKTFPITIRSPGPCTLTVQDSANNLQDSVQNLDVVAGSAVRFTMDLPAEVTAGQAVTFRVTPVDANGNETPFIGSVTFGTTVLNAKLPLDTPLDAPFPATFTVTFFSAAPEAREFTVTDVSSGRGITGSNHVTVRPAQFQRVMLSSAPANPVPGCGEVTLTLTSVDNWGNAVLDTPTTHVSLCKTQGTSAAFVSTTLGGYETPSDCVSGVLQSSAQVVWKDKQGESVEFKLSGADTTAPLVVSWKPCLAPFVQLQVVTPAERRVAEPGELVEFEVQVSNSGEVPITDGVLMLSGDGLTVLSASLNGQPLPAQGAGFALPEVRKGAPLTVKITAQATTQPDRAMEAQVWCTQADGAKLTEKQPVSFTPVAAGVDVGCGCHASAPPSQLLPWLALLLAASRPWERLRRLRRGERNDR